MICFNCAEKGHILKDCPKPAVTCPHPKCRKQHLPQFCFWNNPSQIKDRRLREMWEAKIKAYNSSSDATFAIDDPEEEEAEELSIFTMQERPADNYPSDQCMACTTLESTPDEEGAIWIESGDGWDDCHPHPWQWHDELEGEWDDYDQPYTPTIRRSGPEKYPTTAEEAEEQLRRFNERTLPKRASQGKLEQTGAAATTPAMEPGPNDTYVHCVFTSDTEPQVAPARIDRVDFARVPANGNVLVGKTCHRPTRGMSNIRLARSRGRRSKHYPKCHGTWSGISISPSCRAALN